VSSSLAPLRLSQPFSTSTTLLRTHSDYNGRYGTSESHTRLYYAPTSLSATPSSNESSSSGIGVRRHIAQAQHIDWTRYLNQLHDRLVHQYGLEQSPSLHIGLFGAWSAGEKVKTSRAKASVIPAAMVQTSSRVRSTWSMRDHRHPQA
jgi:hypothetical protein